MLHSLCTLHRFRELQILDFFYIIFILRIRLFVWFIKVFASYFVNLEVYYLRVQLVLLFDLRTYTKEVLHRR